MILAAMPTVFLGGFNNWSPPVPASCGANAATCTFMMGNNGVSMTANFD